MAGPPWFSHGAKVVQASVELYRGQTWEQAYTLSQVTPVPGPRDFTLFDPDGFFMVVASGSDTVRVEATDGVRHVTTQGDLTSGQLRLVATQALTQAIFDMVAANWGTGLASIWGKSLEALGDPEGTLILLWQATVYALEAHS